MAQQNIPNYYIPTNNSDEAHAAYAAWSNHYAAGWPHSDPGYQPVPVYYGAPHSYPYAYPYPYPVPAAAPAPGPQYYNAPPEPKKDDKKDEDKKDKKKKKDDDGNLEYIHYYVPAGCPDRVVDGIHPDGKHFNISIDTATQPETDRDAGKYHMNYYGRTAEQVQTDRNKVQIDKGLYKPRGKVPRAKGSDMFWVVDTLDGNRTKTMYFDEIEGKLKGTWKVDERHGNSYFEKTGVIKEKTGWEID